MGIIVNNTTNSCIFISILEGLKMYKIRTVVAISDRLTRGPLLHRMALRDGFELLAESKNGLDALALAKRHHPQLLITDVLPSCAENVALLKRLVEHRPRMRVMLISPYYTDWMSQQMCAKNIDVFFSVPFISDFLLDRCEAFCAPSSYSEDTLPTSFPTAINPPTAFSSL